MKQFTPTEKKIRELAKAKRLSLRALAREANVAYGTIHNVMKQEHGQFDIMQRIASALGVGIDEIFDLSNQKVNQKNESKPMQVAVSNPSAMDKDKYIAFLEKEVEFLKGLLSDQMSYLKLAADSQPEAVIIPMNRAADYQPAKAV